MRRPRPFRRHRPWTTLRLRFGLIIAGVVVLLGLANRVYLERRVLGEMEGDLDSKALAMARYLAADSVDLVLYQDVVRLQDLLEKAVASTPSFAYAYILDPGGAVLVHTFQGAFPEGLRSLNRLNPGQEMGERHLTVLGQNFRDFAVGIHGGRLGVLHLGLGDREILDRMASVRRDTALMTAAFILLGVVAAWAFTGLLLRPLDRIVNTLQRFRPGVHREEIPPRSDEIGDVAVRINEVTARLHETHLQMLQAEKLSSVGRLAAGVAHEINNPLSGALHCIENLRSDDADGDQRRQYYGLMADGITRAQRVVRNLLEFGRQHPPELQAVDLNLVVRKVLDLMGAPASRAGVGVEPRLAADLPVLRADPHQLAQVMMNLVLNALEALPPGGRIVVETAPADGGCRLRVLDDGPGIPPALRGRIFDPFFTTKEARGGSGLGLSVSLGVVERHGGRIDVGEAPGGGAAFEVWLPAAGGGGGEVADG